MRVQQYASVNLQQFVSHCITTTTTTTQCYISTDLVNLQQKTKLEITMSKLSSTT